MGLVKESSGTTEVGLKDMADQAEFVWFSRHFFGVHLLCAIFCVWACGRNRRCICRVINPEEAEPAGKPWGHHSSILPSFSLAHLFCPRLGMLCTHSVRPHFCPYLFLPKIGPLSSPLLTPWFQPRFALFLGNRKAFHMAFLTRLSFSCNPNFILHTAAKLSSASE